MAQTDNAQEANQIIEIIKSINTPTTTIPIKIKNDNRGVIMMANNKLTTKRATYIK